jgi:hypothetical protein
MDTKSRRLRLVLGHGYCVTMAAEFVSIVPRFVRVLDVRRHMTDPTDDEVQLAEELAEQALAGFDPLMSARERTAIKEQLVDELLFTEAGRLQLKAALPAPVVDHSGEIAREGESRRKAGSSS